MLAFPDWRQMAVNNNYGHLSSKNLYNAEKSVNNLTNDSLLLCFTLLALLTYLEINHLPTYLRTLYLTLPYFTLLYSALLYSTLLCSALLCSALLNSALLYCTGLGSKTGGGKGGYAASKQASKQALDDTHRHLNH